MSDQIVGIADVKCKANRDRLPQNLFLDKIDALSDYRVVEMLLLLTNTRVNAKRLAKSSFVQHKSLHKLLTEEPSRLRSIGFDDATIGVFDLVHESSRRLAASETKLRPVLSDTDSLAAYLDIPNRSICVPHLAIMLLNGRNQMLEEITFFENEEPASIVFSCGKRALEIHASAIILATIRPEQTVLPTGRDFEVTRRIAKIATSLAITFHEHIIFTKNKSYSLKFEVDLASCSLGLKNINDNGTDRPSRLTPRERSLGEVAVPVSGFSDSNAFSTLISLQCVTTKATAVPYVDVVRGSHKLRTLNDTTLMALLLSHAARRHSDKTPDHIFVCNHSYATLLSIPTFKLLELPGLSTYGITVIKLIHAAALRLFRAAIMDQPSLDGFEKLTRYLRSRFESHEASSRGPGELNFLLGSWPILPEARFRGLGR